MSAARRGFSSLGGYQQDGYELSGVGDSAAINAARLTASVFPDAGCAAADGTNLHAAGG